MISSIQNSSYTASQYAGSVAAAQMSGAEETEIAAASSSAQAAVNVDTVTISAEGAAYASQSDESFSNSASLLSILALEETESGSDDLSSYSESELAQMLDNGEITQAEYDAELLLREEATAEISEAASTGAGTETESAGEIIEGAEASEDSGETSEEATSLSEWLASLSEVQRFSLIRSTFYGESISSLIESMLDPDTALSNLNTAIAQYNGSAFSVEGSSTVSLTNILE